MCGGGGGSQNDPIIRIEGSVAFKEIWNSKHKTKSPALLRDDTVTLYA